MSDAYNSPPNESWQRGLRRDLHRSADGPVPERVSQPLNGGRVLQTDREFRTFHPVPLPTEFAERKALQQLTQDITNRMTWEAERRRKRRHLRTSLLLFLLTLFSTTLVGADYWPLDLLPGYFNDAYRDRVLTHLNRTWPTTGPGMTLNDRMLQALQRGCLYSVPLMFILFCHEMGHFLQAMRHRVPASLPYFIPLPLPPLGTMGAVILQGRGAADRKKMFDIAVTGPIAGLIVTLPVLYFGIQSSGYSFVPPVDFQFGQPALVQWLIQAVHGPAPPGAVFVWNSLATAGWVGVFITAMNLLPIGQLDGGHILYTLIGRPAHYVAWGLILLAVGLMLQTQMYSYILLLVLLTLTGPRHPPTADDTVPLGLPRHLLGWLTLSFLVIGFTPQPIALPENRQPVEVEPLEEIPEDWFQDDPLFVIHGWQQLAAPVQQPAIHSEISVGPSRQFTASLFADRAADVCG